MKSISIYDATMEDIFPPNEWRCRNDKKKKYFKYHKWTSRIDEIVSDTCLRCGEVDS